MSIQKRLFAALALLPLTMSGISQAQTGSTGGSATGGTSTSGMGSATNTGGTSGVSNGVNAADGTSAPGSNVGTRTNASGAVGVGNNPNYNTPPTATPPSDSNPLANPNADTTGTLDTTTGSNQNRQRINKKAPARRQTRYQGQKSNPDPTIPPEHQTGPMGTPPSNSTGR